MNKLIIIILLLITFNSYSQKTTMYSSQHNTYYDMDTVDTYRTANYHIINDEQIIYFEPTLSLRRPLNPRGYTIKKIKQTNNKIIYTTIVDSIKFILYPTENKMIVKEKNNLGIWYDYAISEKLTKY